MNETIIKLFNKAIPKGQKLPFDEVNKVAVEFGWIIHPDLCTVEILQWLSANKRNYNSSFYKKWNSIITKNRFELYLDQLMHYASTYGTNYQGEVWIAEKEVQAPELEKMQVISPITKEEVIERCEEMLFAGIALSQDTIEDIVNIFKSLNYIVDITKVKNKESKMLLHKELGSFPEPPVEMLRFLVYLAIGKTLLIKDETTIDMLKVSKFDVSVLIKQYGHEKLSEIFLRFKPIFLAFRTTKQNKICINKLRRLAVKNHKPLNPGYFENIINNKKSISELSQRLNHITNYKKIALLQTILIRKKELETRAFLIRNQKLFIKSEIVKADKEYLDILYSTIYFHLVECLNKKATTISFPEGVTLTAPTSEKSFVGNYPLGTSFDFSDADNIIGIHWKAEDGAHDLDLKLIDIDGKMYGWNAAYKNPTNSIVYSGDLTSANPEATELFYASKGFRPAIVKVNLYNGSKDAKFRFFMAKEKVVDMKRGYMVNPNNIIVNVACKMDSSEKSLGVITDSKFILAQFRTGRGRVAYRSVTDLYTSYALDTLDCYLSLKKLLTDAGYKIVKSGAEIDLTNLSKDTLLNIFKL